MKKEEYKKKRKYPKKGKPRKLDYSTITKLVNKFGLKKLKNHLP